MRSALLDGSTLLITGATFGIGEALTRHLMSYKVHLILVARTEDKLLALKNDAASLPAEVTTFTCDLYDEQNVADLCNTLESFSIHYFVSNAGKSIMRSLNEGKLQDYKKTIALNYLAPVQIITSLRTQFAECKTHIINVSTYNVLMKIPPKWGAYVASKKAIHSWYESNRAELKLMNITISHVYLPLVESRMKTPTLNTITFVQCRWTGLSRPSCKVLPNERILCHGGIYHSSWSCFLEVHSGI